MLFKIKIFVENIFLYIYIYICFNLSEAQTTMPYKKLINYREEWHQKKKKKHIELFTPTILQGSISNPGFHLKEWTHS